MQAISLLNSRSIRFSFGFLLLCFTLLVHPSYGAKQLQSELPSQLEDSIKSCLNRGALSEASMYANRLMNTSIQNALPETEAAAYSNLAWVYQQYNNVDSAIYFYTKHDSICKALNATRKQGQTKIRIAALYKERSDFKNAERYYLEAEVLLREVSDSLWLGFLNDHLGHVYHSIGNYYNALDRYQQAIRLFSDLQIFQSVGGVYNKMGMVYRETDNKEEEKRSYNKAIGILKELPESIYLAESLNNLAEIYFDEDSAAIAFVMLEQAKVIYEKFNHQIGLSAYHAVLSYYYYTLNPPNYHNAIELGMQGAEIALQSNNFRGYADATYYVGTSYFKLEQNENAIETLISGYDVATKYNLLAELSEICKALSTVYMEEGDKVQAFNFLDEHLILSDSLSNIDRVKEFTRLDLSYKFKKEQYQDSLLQVEHENELIFKHEEDLQKQKIRQLILAMLLLVLLIVAGTIFIFARKRRLQNIILNDKNRMINQQKAEIEDNAVKIEEAFTKLQKLDEYKQASTNMLVHDLKNPLGALLNLQVFESEKEKDEIVKHTTGQMLHLVENMLDVSKAENDSLNIELEAVLLHEMLCEATKDIAFLCKNSGVDIVFQSQSNNFIIQADWHILKRLLMNLLTNAVKFSPSGSAVEIEVGLTTEHTLRIDIVDQGPGIAPENHKLIFEQFKQVQSKRIGSSGSSGLGLAFCRLATEAHNWKIGVDSEIGEGARFWIEIKDFDLGAKGVHGHHSSLKLEIRNTVSAIDLARIRSKVQSLEKLEVYAISEIKALLRSIQTENIQGIDSWLKEVNDAVSFLDNEQYLKLVKSLLNE